MSTGSEGRRALVTGGTGFTGSALVRRLLETGWRVRVLDNQKGRFHDELAGAGAEIVLGSVTDRDVCREAVAGCDVVFHLAAAFRVINAPKGSARSKLKLGEYPEDLGARSTIGKLLKLHGYKSTPNAYVGKYGSFVAVKASGVHTVIGILHDPDGPKGKRYTSARKQIVAAAKRLLKKIGGTVTCAVITHSGSKPFAFHAINAKLD